MLCNKDCLSLEGQNFPPQIVFAHICTCINTAEESDINSIMDTTNQGNMVLYTFVHVHVGHCFHTGDIGWWSIIDLVGGVSYW